MDASLQQSYDYCCHVAKTKAQNFYYAFILLPPEKRNALCAIYAFMRQCDDLSDDEDDGVKARSRLQEFRTNLDESAQGREPQTAVCSPQSSFWPAFADTVRTYGIPSQHFHEVIDGAEMDLDVHRYRTFDDLYRYCYLVASSVGLICLRVFGFKDDAALKPAEHLGIAFQLTNILRDVKEDADRGRIYLPTEDLGTFGISAKDVLDGNWSDRFSQLVQFEADRAAAYYTRAEPLFTLVHPESRSALRAMANIYGGILKKIQNPNFNVFRQRARLSAIRKLSVLASAKIGRG